MKAKKVKYERLVNTGDYSHEKYGIEIVIEKKDSVNNAFESAKKAIEHQLKAPSGYKRQVAEEVRAYNEEEFPF